MLSILVPIFNEEGAVQHTLTRLHEEVLRYDLDAEIIAIDDGSTDKTYVRIKGLEYVKVIKHRHNRGYGASLKTGLRHAKGDWVAIIDADGTYRAKDLIRLYNLAREKDLDMMVGDRSRYMSSVPWYRRPGKAIIYWLAAFLLWQKVPDINSGLRVFRKSMAMQFMHLYPQGFSFTVTITLASLTNNYLVDWDSIRYDKRIGSSQINFTRGLFYTFPNFVALVIRIITYFKPLRFFFVPAGLCIFVGIVNLLRTLIQEDNISDATLLLLLTGTQIGLMGLIADVIVKSRQGSTYSD